MASSKKPKKEQLQDAITAWVDWYRGLNDPQMRNKVAERQLGALMAEKSMSHYEVIFGGRQVPRVILYAPGVKALAALQWALARVFPKVRSEVIVDDGKSTAPKPSLRAFIKELGEDRAKAKRAKKTK